MFQYIFIFFRNFVPGNFLDEFGNSRAIPLPPVKSILEQFLKKVNQRNDTFLWAGANFLVCISLQLISIVVLCGALGVIFPIYKVSLTMNSQLPESHSKRAKKIAKKLLRNESKIKGYTLGAFSKKVQEFLSKKISGNSTNHKSADENKKKKTADSKTKMTTNKGRKRSDERKARFSR